MPSIKNIQIKEYRNGANTIVESLVMQYDQDGVTRKVFADLVDRFHYVVIDVATGKELADEELVIFDDGDLDPMGDMLLESVARKTGQVIQDNDGSNAIVMVAVDQSVVRYNLDHAHVEVIFGGELIAQLYG